MPDLPPFQRHSETSREAALRMIDHAPSLRARTYRYLLKRGARGATDEEIQLASGLNPSTQRPRRIELVEMGLVRDSGQIRLTVSGREAVVWVALRPEELKA